MKASSLQEGFFGAISNPAALLALGGGEDFCFLIPRSQKCEELFVGSESEQPHAGFSDTI